MLPQEFYKRFAVLTLYAAVAAAVVYLVFSYLWGVILPFLVAYVFAELFKPVVKYSETHSRFPKRTFVLAVVLLTAGALGMLVFAIGRQLITEISELSVSVKNMLSLIRSDDAYAARAIDKINSMVPFVDIRERLWDMRGNLEEELLGMLLSFGEKLSGGIITFLGKSAAFLPNALLTSAVVIIATYYFAVDRVKVNCFFLSLFPKKMRPMLKKAKDELSETVGKYLRAYGLLFVITFCELLAAFLLMDIEYALVLALVIAIIDILPVLGTGTVLVPWGLGSLLLGNYSRGTWLLVTYAAITVIRQVLEPKIVGKYIGLSPLAALASMYIGLKLMSLAGLVVFPLGAIVLKRAIELKNRNESAENKMTTETIKDGVK